ncbi:MAG TPA: acyl carrier protein [Gemmata sp.]|jgi:hypothetical protein|nr:acyl carrier protein [Gemmata sp.]
MGLDIVEFVMDVEESFGISIPDDVAERITTPRKLIDYIHGRVPHKSTSLCLSQRAFYSIRRALVQRVGLPRSQLRPGTDLLSVLPAQNAQAVWNEVGESLGYRDGRWPHLYRSGWLTRFFVSDPPRTLGEVARSVVSCTTPARKPAGERWSRPEIEAVIAGLLREHFDIQRYSLDDRFVEDLGLG